MIEVEIKDLIVKAQNGDKEAFGQIYEVYLTPIYRYFYFRTSDADLANDLTQDVFIKIFNSLDTYKITDRNPLTYFYTIARNLLIDNYRRKKIPTIADEAAENLLVENETPKTIAEQKDQISELKQALNQLSENEADALILKYLDDKSNLEISKIMGKSEEAVRQLQSRGIKNLRQIINFKE